MIPRAIFEHTLLGFFAPIRRFLDDDGVSEVLINGPDTIYVERRGLLERTDARFASREALVAALRNLAQYVGRGFDERHPVLEARLPDGSRVEAVMHPAAPDGPSVAIRRFFRETLTWSRLVELGSVTETAMSLLDALVAARKNIVVSGGTASGKTSLLNVLSSFCSTRERIVVIEDSRELQLGQEHVVHLEAQPGLTDGRGRITIRQLFRASLRLRPDRIVVGEVRGGEALDLVQAMTSGHGGCMSTVHASTPRDALARLETMALMSDLDLPLSALRTQLASAVDFVIQVDRLGDGRRHVTAISEVAGHDPATGYQLVDLYVRNFHRDPETGTLASRLCATGEVPRCATYLQAIGFSLPADMREAAGTRSTITAS